VSIICRAASGLHLLDQLGAAATFEQRRLERADQLVGCCGSRH
jgi:hypothetical protein